MENWHLPQGWAWIPIEKVGRFRGGGTPSKSKPEYWSGTIPWVSPKDMKSLEILDTQDHITAEGLDNSSAKRIPPGSVLIVFRSGILAHSLPVAIAKRELTINQDLKAIIPHEGFDPYYVLYALKAMSGVLLARCTKKGATVHSLEYSRFSAESLPVPYPDDPARSLDEQRRVVARIEALFARIEEARHLRSVAGEEAERLMDAAMAEVFRIPEDQLPEGWEWYTLSEVCEINPRKPSLERDESALTSFVPMAAVDEEKGAITDMEVKPYSEVKRGYTYFEENDVLFAKITPSMENGKSAIAQGLIDGIGFGSTEFHRLRPGERVIPELVHLFVRQQSFREEAASHFRGSVGQQRVPKGFLETHLIPVPPTDEQRRITEYLCDVQVQVQSLKGAQEAAEVELDRLEHAILARAFRGEL